MSRSQWPRGLRRYNAAVRLLGLWVRIPRGVWMSVSCECCVSSGRGLCDGLSTRLEVSCGLWYVVVCSRGTSYRMSRPIRVVEPWELIIIIIIRYMFPILYYFHYSVLICSTYGAEGRCVQGLVRKPAGKGPLEKPRRRWIFEKRDAGTRTVYIWFRIGTCGRLLWMQ